MKIECVCGEQVALPHVGSNPSICTCGVMYTATVDMPTLLRRQRDLGALITSLSDRVLELSAWQEKRTERKR